MRKRNWWCLLITFFFYACNNDTHPSFEGYIEAENIYIASPYSGRLDHLWVKQGQHVNKGNLLFNLDPNPQQFRVTQLKSELEQARNTLIDLKKPRRAQEISAIQAQIEQVAAQITLAEIRVSRFQKLYDKNASDQDTLDAAKANLQQQKDLKLQYEENLALAKLGGREDQIKAQQNQVDALTAKLEDAQWALLQKSQSAPASGLIFDTLYREGEFVINQQPVLALLSAENIKVEFFVPVKYLSQFSLGQTIHFNCEGCQENNPATISFISPEAEYLPPLVYSRENNANLVFKIRARIANPFSFKPGQPVVVTI